MRIKKYVADSMPGALKLVKSDLGPKAVILNTRTVDRSGLLGKKGQIEVTAAVDDKPVKRAPQAGTAKKAQAAPAKKPAKAPVKADPLKPAPRSKPAAAPAASTKAAPDASEIERLSAQIRALQASLRPATPALAPLADDLLPGALGALVRQLREDGLAGSIAQDTLKHLLAAGGAFDDEDALRERAAGHVAGRMPEPAATRLSDKVRNVIALVGPSGAGKTTALAKLAAQFSGAGARVALITTDTDRVGGLEQIRAYAGILDLPVDVAYTADEMHGVIQARRDVGVVLIDTAGISPLNRDELRSLDTVLREAGPNETHLVLGATTGLETMRDALAGFRGVGIDRLLFTRLDETHRFGAACTMAVESNVPMSYITNSRTVPGDIHSARPQALTTALLKRSLNGALDRA